MRKHKRLVYGAGINDANYGIWSIFSGRRVMCPFYRKWASMLERCYSEKLHAKQPTYTECSVCSEWLVFSNFKKWMEQQDWEGKELDKDLLVTGNKVYSPESCVFISKIINGFLVDRSAMRGRWPIGVYFNNKDNKFQAQCRNPFSKKYEFLGQFTCPEQAHQAWKKRKHELACQLAETQSDERVTKALLGKYI